VCPLCDDEPAHKELQEEDERLKQAIRRTQLTMVQEMCALSFFDFLANVEFHKIKIEL
jgi:hypothetical protein